jgi:hypothetical protein
VGGMLGIGGSSTKTDRGNQLAAVQGNYNLFNYGMPTGEAQQTAGTNTLSSALSTTGTAADYFKSLLQGGRTATAARSAPAINSVNAGTTEQRTAAGQFGTDRTGGTVAANREASTTAQSKIDDIINENLVTGQQQGAAGLQQTAGIQAGIGGEQLSNALSLLGLSQDSINSILTSSLQSRQVDFAQQQATGAGIGQLLLAGLQIAGVA